MAVALIAIAVRGSPPVQPAVAQIAGPIEVYSCDPYAFSTRCPSITADDRLLVEPNWVP